MAVFQDDDFWADQMYRNRERKAVDLSYRTVFDDLRRKQDAAWDAVEKQRKEEDKFIDDRNWFRVQKQRQMEDRFMAADFKREKDALADQWARDIRRIDEDRYP